MPKAPAALALRVRGPAILTVLRDPVVRRAVLANPVAVRRKAPVNQAVLRQVLRAVPTSDRVRMDGMVRTTGLTVRRTVPIVAAHVVAARSSDASRKWPVS